MTEQKDWASDFYQEASKKANEVVKEAYSRSSHYIDAIKYVRKIKQLLLEKFLIKQLILRCGCSS